MTKNPSNFFCYPMMQAESLAYIAVFFSLFTYLQSRMSDNFKALSCFFSSSLNHQTFLRLHRSVSRKRTESIQHSRVSIKTPLKRLLVQTMKGRLNERKVNGQLCMHFSETMMHYVLFYPTIMFSWLSVSIKQGDVIRYTYINVLPVVQRLLLGGTPGFSVCQHHPCNQRQ